MKQIPLYNFFTDYLYDGEGRTKAQAVEEFTKIFGLRKARTMAEYLRSAVIESMWVTTDGERAWLTQEAVRGQKVPVDSHPLLMQLDDYK